MKEKTKTEVEKIKCNLCKNKINLKEGLIGIHKMILCVKCFDKIVLNYQNSGLAPKKQIHPIEKNSITSKILKNIKGLIIFGN